MRAIYFTILFLVAGLLTNAQKQFTVEGHLAEPQAGYIFYLPG